MGKLGKEIENRLNVTRKVAAAAETHGPNLAPTVAARMQELHGQGAPTAVAIASLFAALDGSAKGAASRLEATALKLAAEQADDHAPRRQRDEATEAALAVMTRLRSAVSDALGAEGLATYGLAGETPRTPKALSAHLTNVANLLGEKPATVTTEFGGTFDSAAARTALLAKNAPLAAALGVVDREERELEEALGQRDQALASWTEVYQGVATTLEGLFRMAGRPDLALRVRPTSRTVSGEDAGPEEPAGGGEG